MVKLLLREHGTEQTKHRITSNSGRLFASELQRLEMRSAVIRKHSTGDLTQDAFQSAIVTIDRVLDLFTLTPITTQLLTLGVGLIVKHKLRTLDTIQLASAIFASDAFSTRLTFVTADKTLLQAATASGLGTLNPEELITPPPS